MNELTIILRDWYAGMALQGLLSAPTLRWCPKCGNVEEMGEHNALERFYSIPDICRQSFEIADAMLEARNNTLPSALPRRTEGDQQPPTCKE